MATITLPDSYQLTYTVMHEAHWWPILKANGAAPDDGHPSININARNPDGRSKWDFSITDRELRNASPSLRLAIFDEDWDAFDLLAPFFAALAAGRAKTIEDVRALLDSFGATDVTERTAR
jgi:hypothetical protein